MFRLWCSLQAHLLQMIQSQASRVFHQWALDEEWGLTSNSAETRNECNRAGRNSPDLELDAKQAIIYYPVFPYVQVYIDIILFGIGPHAFPIRQSDAIKRLLIKFMNRDIVPKNKRNRKKKKMNSSHNNLKAIVTLLLYIMSPLHIQTHPWAIQSWIKKFRAFEK